MRLIILAGFLGAGKTSVLLHLARFLAGRASFRPNALVIIENEIGQAGVDGRALGGQGYEVRELTAGCICCTLAGDLVTALQEIRADLNPSWVLIEATGIAQHKIADVVKQSLGYSGPEPVTLAIADAERWSELMEAMPMFISRQLEGADVVLINKVDLVSPELLAQVDAQIKELVGAGTTCYQISAIANEASQLWLEDFWKSLTQHD